VSISERVWILWEFVGVVAWIGLVTAAFNVVIVVAIVFTTCIVLTIASVHFGIVALDTTLTLFFWVVRYCIFVQDRKVAFWVVVAVSERVWILWKFVRVVAGIGLVTAAFNVVIVTFVEWRNHG